MKRKKKKEKGKTKEKRIGRAEYELRTSRCGDSDEMAEKMETHPSGFVVNGRLHHVLLSGLLAEML